MKAMILAAGLGQRMRPLTDNCPKPLLCAGGKSLLQYHLEALAENNIDQVIINLAYLGGKIREFVGNGSRFGLHVSYSPEPEPLETAGALLHALPLLGKEPFILLNGDVWSDFPLHHLCTHQLTNNERAHLVLVANPDFHPLGDFAPDLNGILASDGQIIQKNLAKFTFAGISLIDPRLISEYPQQRAKFPLVEVLRHGINQQQITGEVYGGAWSDVGTPARLQLLDQQLTSKVNS